MTDDPRHNRPDDDPRLRELLQSVGQDAAAPDLDALEGIRHAVGDAFAAAAKPQAVNATSVQSQQSRESERRSMFTISRIAAVCLTAVAGLSLLITSLIGPTDTDVALGEVLKRLDTAQILHVEVTQGENRSEIWVRQPGEVRWQDSPTRYEIARGSRLWRVDEEANMVAAEDSPWFREAGRSISVFDLLGLDEQESTELAAAEPVGIEDYDRDRCYRYRVDVPTGDKSLELLAFADVKSRQLRGLRLIDPAAAAGPPVAEFRLIAMNEPVDESLFAVSGSLSEDGRIGKVLSAQGIVSLKPVMNRRWTPVARQVLVKPGDWLRTDVRGANAALVALTSPVQVTTGPASLVEFISPREIRLYQGTVQINLAGEMEQPFVLLGPGESRLEMTAEGKQIVRVARDQRLATVAEPPLWLQGFEGTTNNESLGSLIANVDGRNEPLTIGYHHVSVEIRDQIARTTVEESFVNHTPNRLEGVFHFPLPQDASISGFGMWIGDELVEADVVEKQRAREIYETILREKRDPGLLEWTGGNIFKARVFPIEANREKRIKIVYTQVLPLRGNRYRYSYGLNSELLRKNPVRELSLDVLAYSALPIAGVECPTHAVRSDKTPHSAHVEFTRQEYTPDRDFEVVFELDQSQSDVVVIPHRRGDDGYFLLQLMPPSPEGRWQRQASTDGDDGKVVQVENSTRTVWINLGLLDHLTPHVTFNVYANDQRAGNNAKAKIEVTKLIGPHAAEARIIQEDLARPINASDPIGRVERAASVKREVLPDGQPLDLTILCDTSASMDSTKRREQSEFVAALLAALGEDDRFRLACCDVDTVWAFQDPVASTDETRAQAAEFLDGRLSLGWTDLDQAFAAVEEAAAAGSHVIYVGDGIVSTGDADPAAFVNRLRRKYDGNKTATGRFHAVTVGNSYESVVLRGIASLGGGSMRAVSGEETPPTVALELLNEIAQPGLTDINLEFRGLQVAAVYPESLPNLAAGRQQIVIGRYLPRGENQQGEVVVTGRLGGESVRYVAPVTLEDAEEGNSFIPRLWARMHLDHLLQQGSNQFIRDEIIALSEEYHIITPYTSLLVLESDADRERFGVKRRYQMRDGERFFAEGRDNATYELVQQQMLRAGNWRIGLRRQVLAQLAQLGRDPSVFQQVEQYPALRERLQLGDQMLPVNGPIGRSSGFGRGVGGGMMGGMGGGFFGGEFFGVKAALGLGFPVDESGVFSRDSKSLASSQLGRELDLLEDFNGNGLLGDMRKESESFDSQAESIPFVSEPGGESDRLGNLSASYLRDDVQYFPAGPFGNYAAGVPDFEMARPGILGARISGLERAGRRLMPMFGPRGNRPMGGFALNGFRQYYNPTPDYLSWVNQYFPQLPPTPAAVTSAPQQADWPADVRAVTDDLYQQDDLLALDGGVEVRIATEARDPRWDRITSHNERLELFAPTAWLTRPIGPGWDIIINWCDQEQRGVYSATFGLGRERASMPVELTRQTVGASCYAQQPLQQTFSYTNAELVSHDNDVAVVLLTNRNDKQDQWRLTIDTAKHVVLKSESLREGEVTATTTYGGHVEVQGLWWPTNIVTADAKGRTTSTTTQTVTAHTADEHQARMAAELNGDVEGVTFGRDDTLFIEFPFVRLDAAKQAVADGSAGFNKHLAVLLHFTLSQQWDEVRARLESIEQLAAGKPGITWLQAAVWANTRSNEDVHQLLLAQARALLNEGREDTYPVAERIRSAAYPITDWNEYGEILQVLKPVFDAQPATQGTSLYWQRQWLQTLQNLGRQDEALPLLRSMAEANPWDIGLQTEYASTLVNRGDRDAGFAWLDAQLARETPFEEWERNQIYQTCDQLLRNLGEYDRLVSTLEGWIENEPSSEDAYSRYLSALVFDDQVDRAKQLVRDWTAAGRLEGKLPDDVKARLNAAVSFMLGQTYNIYWYHVDVAWLPLLQETADFHMRQWESFDVAQQIMGNGSFRDSDECDAVLRNVLSLLQADAETLPPLQLSTMAGWLFWGQIPVTAADVQPIAEVIRQRWAVDGDFRDRHWLGQALVTIYSNRFADTEYLPFLRLQIESGPPEYRAEYVQALFDALLARNWQEEYEKEAFALLPRLGETMNDKPLTPIAEDDIDAQTALAQRLFQQVGALHRLVDRMLETRYQADLTKFQDTGHPEELTRQALAEKQAEFRTAAREGLAERLEMVATREDLRIPPAGAPETIIQEVLAEWAFLERMHLNVALNRDLAGVAAQCWTILGDEPPRIAEPEEAQASDEPLAGPVELSRELLDGLRRYRALMIVMNLGSRRSADPQLVDRVLNYLKAGANRETDDSVAWKQALYLFLVALDRPDDLIVRLHEWIAEDEFTAPWRIALGRLLAERGELREAIRLYEAVLRNDELSPADRLLLADWYQAVDQREQYEDSRVAAYKVMEEWQLQQLIQQHVYQWQQPNGPRGNYVDDDVLFALRALYEKSNAPGSYLSLAQNLYQACRDFRVLKMLPDSVVGRTPQEVYSFLGNMNSILGEIRKEATSDEVLTRIEELRGSERVQTAIDHRALDLLQALVERRASEVLNQPGPHVDAALAALQRAFDREWADGERRQMAEFLAGLGNITQTALADEQMRELRSLAADSDPATDDGLWIIYRLCQALFNSYGKHDEALTRMTAEIRDYEQAHPDGWPSHANEPLSGYLSFLEQQQSYTTGETLLVRYLAAPLNEGQRYWLTERLDQLYLHALANDGQVSLGSGETLYTNLRDRVIDECSTPDDNHRSNLIYRLMDVYRRAKDKHYPTAGDDLVQFAFQTLPELLAVQANGYGNVIQNVAGTVHDVVSVRAGLRFLIVRIEHYPARLDFTYENAWQQFGGTLAWWRFENKEPLGELEPRLLNIVLNELRRDLLQREQRNRSMYHDNYSYYWGEHAADFRRAAEEVYEQRRHSGRSIKYIAQYLWEGLGEHNRPIEMLFVALRDGILDESGRQQLVSYLFSANRHDEAVPVLEPLVEEHPDNITYRTQLMVAYYHSQRPQQLRTLLAATDEHFRQAGRWVEGAIAALGQACVECGLYEQAVGYYGEVIPLHQRTQPNQGIGDGTLSNYYEQLAMAHSHLGHTAEAVDAAASAIIAWGPRLDQRANSLQTLNNVLNAAADLDEYVASLDAKSEETHEDSPILRKAIGMLYQERENYTEAARNLEIALELRPGDPEIYTRLRTCYDKLDRNADAVRLLLAQIDLDSHDLSLYEQLVDRFANDPAQAERAATSIVEAAPLEAENHQRLAEIRKKQQRYDDAVAQWRRVAELRSLEPNGLLGLASAELDAGDPAAARRTVRQLRQTEWPSRFNNELSARLPELDRRIQETQR